MGNNASCYDLEDFISACEKGVVEVWRPALRDASYFGIKDRDERKVLKFISSGGLEDLDFIDSLPLRSSSETPQPLVDDYSFWSGWKKGYIAFFYSLRERQWEIKSFKEHKVVDNQLTAGLEQLDKIRIKKEGVKL